MTAMKGQTLLKTLRMCRWWWAASSPMWWRSEWPRSRASNTCSSWPMKMKRVVADSGTPSPGEPEEDEEGMRVCCIHGNCLHEPHHATPFLRLGMTTFTWRNTYFLGHSSHFFLSLPCVVLPVFLAILGIFGQVSSNVLFIFICIFLYLIFSYASVKYIQMFVCNFILPLTYSSPVLRWYIMNVNGVLVYG